MNKNATIAKRSEVEAYADSLEQQITAAKNEQARLRQIKADNTKAHNDKINALAEKYRALLNAANNKGEAAVAKANAVIDAAIEDENLEIVLLTGELKTARRQATELTARISEESVNAERSL